MANAGAVYVKPILFERRLKLAVWLLGFVAGACIVGYGVLTGLTEFELRVSIMLAMEAFLAPPAFLYALEYKRLRLINRHLPILLDDVADLQDAGVDFIKALEACSSRDYGPLTSPLKKAVILLSWGVSFEESMRRLAKEAKAENAQIVTAILTAAVKMGGEVRLVFRSLASFVRELNGLERERLSRIRSYVVIIYTTVITLMIIMWLIHSQLLVITHQASVGITGRIALGSEAFKLIVADLAMLESLFSGLIAGKLEGSIRLGIRHIFVLLAIAILFMVLLFP